jgi:hypothetical protein
LHPGAARPVAEHEGQSSTDKRCEGEHRTCTRRPERTLSEQVEAQAQPITGGTDHEQSRGLPEARQGLAEDPGQGGRGGCAERTLEHHHLTRIAFGHGTR